jgi:hypothetical protein
VNEFATDVASIARQVELSEVRTTGALARLTTGMRMPPPSEPVDLNLATKIGVVRNGPHSFMAVAAFKIRLRTKLNTKPFAAFVYRCFAVYRNVPECSDDVLGAFSQTNSLIHIWPYLRNYVQTASAQLGLSPVTLPVFRVQQRAPTAGPEVPQPSAVR